ncbi:hypothetical protein VDQ94_08410 [Xanthomonas campestris pv. campestris]|nr:hypothetical protein [Xanthomonas campestris pv. campestris]
MLKKLVWTPGRVLSLKITDELYTLAQMREGYMVECFAISSRSGEWSGVDLTMVEPLFTICVTEKLVKSLAIAEPLASEVKPDTRPTSTIMLSAVLGNNGDHGAKLIKLTDQFESYEATVIKENLTVEHDLQDIYTYEMAGMVGDPDKVRRRLIRYFETGVNWDEAKAFLFKGLQPPPSNLKHDVMKGVELLNYPLSDALSQGSPSVLDKIRPLLERLIRELASLPDYVAKEVVVTHFKGIIVQINIYESEIETEEREVILGVIYDLGEMVGLYADTAFAEEWRGDW